MRSPSQHWELDETGSRHRPSCPAAAEFITPIPKPKKRKRQQQQEAMVFDEGKGLSTAGAAVRPDLDHQRAAPAGGPWRTLPNPNHWQVTPETARLLQHWRHHDFSGVRPVLLPDGGGGDGDLADRGGAERRKPGKRFLEHLANANKDANPELMRLALKLATGAGKTTVMAMLIAWQTINAVRRPDSKRFTRGFLVVAPGLTIKDRLRVLQPNDPDSYYASRELVPATCWRSRTGPRSSSPTTTPSSCASGWSSRKGGRSLLQGRTARSSNTLETEGQMLQRVMPDLMGMKNILVLNDEAHHCYREKPRRDEDDEDLKGDERKEAEKNNEAARLWISGAGDGEPQARASPG